MSGASDGHTDFNGCGLPKIRITSDLSPQPTSWFLLAYTIGLGYIGGKKMGQKVATGVRGDLLLLPSEPPQRCSSACYRQLDLPTLSRLLEGRKDGILFASTRSCVSLESSGGFRDHSGHADFKEPPQRCLVKLWVACRLPSFWWLGTGILGTPCLGPKIGSEE